MSSGVMTHAEESEMIYHIYPPLDNLLEKVPNNSRFALIVAAATRARTMLDAIIAKTRKGAYVPDEIRKNPDLYLPKLRHYRCGMFSEVDMRVRGKFFVMALEEIYEDKVEIQLPEEPPEDEVDIIDFIKDLG